MTTVRIEFCDVERDVLVSRHLKKRDEDAIERAVIKHFGLCRTFYPEDGAPSVDGAYFGRVGRYSIIAGKPIMDTGRLRVTVAA